MELGPQLLPASERKLSPDHSSMSRKGISVLPSKVSWNHPSRKTLTSSRCRCQLTASLSETPGTGIPKRDWKSPPDLSSTMGLTRYMGPIYYVIMHYSAFITCKMMALGPMVPLRDGLGHFRTLSDHSVFPNVLHMDALCRWT